MELIFRKAEESEYYATENITREAFWNMYKPGCDEHLVLHQLRQSNSYAGELDIVAVHEGEIIGHVILTKAKVTGEDNSEHQVLCLGPVSVLPDHQKKGAGRKLIRYSISEAKRLGFKAVILFGDPGYYHQFGFKDAREYHIRTKDNQNFEPFMVLELREHGLDNVKGRFFEDDAFLTREDELVEFEKKFEPKVKGKPKIDISLKK